MLDSPVERLGQRLAGFHHVNPQHFEGLIAGLGVVNGAFGDLVGFAGLDLHRRLAVDNQFKLALQHIAGLGAGMGMPAGRAADPARSGRNRRTGRAR